MPRKRRVRCCLAVIVATFGLLSCSSIPKPQSPQAVSLVSGRLPQASPSQRAKINYTVPGAIPVMKQPNGMACWATAAAMLVSWRDKKTYEIEEVLQRAGKKYLDLFRAKQGLDAADKKPFLQAIGLRSENPQSFSERGWLSLLEEHGPLWVTTQLKRTQQEKEKFSVHARIMYGMYEDDSNLYVKIIDPETGSQYDELLIDFVRRYENIAREDLDMNTEFQPQVIHF